MVVVEWDVVSPIGPALAHHVACCYEGHIYLHGGIREVRQKQPESTIWRASLTDPVWTQVNIPGLPALSHHCGVLCGDEWRLIGGWNGKERTSQVYVVNLCSLTTETPPIAGFPKGAGLSSHTATALSDGSILVIGREGGLRTQRKHGLVVYSTGDVYRLTGPPWVYSDAVQLAPASRSGHTTHALSRRLVVLGGRDSDFVETHTFPVGVTGNDAPCETLRLLEELTASMPPVAKPPCSRKLHAGAAGSRHVLVHGGETFDGKSRAAPVADLFLYDSVKNEWRRLVCDTPHSALAAHVCVSDVQHLYIHGGEAPRNEVSGILFRLKLPDVK